MKTPLRAALEEYYRNQLFPGGECCSCLTKLLRVERPGEAVCLYAVVETSTGLRGWEPIKYCPGCGSPLPVEVYSAGN
jgi:hypothetical protein